MRLLRVGLLAMTIVFLAGCAAGRGPSGPILATVPSGELTWIGELPVLHLSGTPYAMGYQHGSLMAPQVRASVANVMAYVAKQAKIPGMGRYLARRMLDQAWRKQAPFVPPDFLEEMEGLADGARVPLKALQRLHALPERMAAHCSSFAAWGTATQGGRLIQMRNLDWAIQSDVQRYSALFVCRPAGKKAFLSLGWLAFMGVISGINEEGISVAEIGAETRDQTLKGIPMPFLLRRVLEESRDLTGAVSIVSLAPRTGGYNYLFADHQEGTAAALETTQNHCAVFYAGKEPVSPWHLPIADCLFRSDFALDPHVRDLQLASKGNPRRPGLESPVGSSAFDIRYWGLGLLLKRFHGRINPEVAMGLARAVAPSSNIQSVIYAFPQVWVVNAAGRRPAAHGAYQEIDAEKLFKKHPLEGRGEETSR